MATALDVDAMYRRYGAMVLRRVRRFVGEEDALDVLQEVFLQVVTHQDSFRGESSPATWLYQVATRTCLNRRRDGDRRRVLLDLKGEISWAPTVARPSQEHVAVLRSLEASMDVELIEVGVYYYLDGMTHAEIADLLGVSRRTVGNRLTELTSRALQTGGPS